MALNRSPVFTMGYMLMQPQGHYLNKFGIYPFDDVTYQISKALGLVVSDKKIFSCFPYYISSL